MQQIQFFQQKNAAKTLQQNQTSLILLQCFWSIFCFLTINLRGYEQHFSSKRRTKMLQFFDSKFYLPPHIYVEFSIHGQRNAVINFEIVLESIIIKDGLKEKTNSLYCPAFTWWRGGSSKEKKSKTKHLGETIAPKKGWTRNLQQS